MEERILDLIDEVCCYDELYETDEFILAMQETYSACIGFDFTIFSTDGHEIDGGIYEDENLDKNAFLRYIAKEFLDCRKEDLRLFEFDQD